MEYYNIFFPFYGFINLYVNVVLTIWFSQTFPLLLKLMYCLQVLLLFFLNILLIPPPPPFFFTLSINLSYYLFLSWYLDFHLFCCLAWLFPTESNHKPEFCFHGFSIFILLMRNQGIFLCIQLLFHDWHLNVAYASFPSIWHINPLLWNWYELYVLVFLTKIHFSGILLYRLSPLSLVMLMMFVCADVLFLFISLLTFFMVFVFLLQVLWGPILL